MADARMDRRQGDVMLGASVQVKGVRHTESAAAAQVERAGGLDAIRGLKRQPSSSIACSSADSSGCGMGLAL